MKNKELAISFGKSLSRVRQLRQLSQEALAGLCELDRTYISQLERGIKMPTIQTLFSLCKSLNISPESLVAQLSDSLTPEKEKNHNEQSMLPILGTSLSCGSPIGQDHVVEKVLSLEDLVIKKPKDTFFAVASGDSMSPDIYDGDYLVIEKNHPVKNGSIVLAQVDNEFTVKRYIKHDNGIFLESTNPLYANISINEHPYSLICGVVIALIRLQP